MLMTLGCWPSKDVLRPLSLPLLCGVRGWNSLCTGNPGREVGVGPGSWSCECSQLPQVNASPFSTKLWRKSAVTRDHWHCAPSLTFRAQVVEGADQLLTNHLDLFHIWTVTRVCPSTRHTDTINDYDFKRRVQVTRCEGGWAVASPKVTCWWGAGKEQKPTAAEDQKDRGRSRWETAA